MYFLVYRVLSLAFRVSRVPVWIYTFFIATSNDIFHTNKLFKMIWLIYKYIFVLSFFKWEWSVTNNFGIKVHRTFGFILYIMLFIKFRIHRIKVLKPYSFYKIMSINDITFCDYLTWSNQFFNRKRFLH